MPPRKPTTQGQATASAVRALQTRPEDASAVQLALHYAHLIDGAAKALLDALAILEDPDVDAGMAERVKALEAQVEAQRVASDLGPKLLAVLVQLGATPAARAANVKGVVAGVDRLAEHRARRAR